MVRKRITKRRRTRRYARKRLSGGANTQETHTPVYPPRKINDLITHIIYINLDKRTDRRAEMEAELSVFTPEKITRLPGINAEQQGIAPAVACTKAHIKALKMARNKNYPNVLILEDDASWVNVDTAFPIFKGLLENPYDVIMLGGTHADYDQDTYRIKSAWTTTSYLAHQNYYDKMIDYLEKRISEYDPTVMRTKNQEQEFAPNVIMVANQVDDNWFIVVPSLMIQRASFSNIEKKKVNYKDEFA